MARFHEAFLVKSRRSYFHHLAFIPDLSQMEPYPRISIGKEHVDLTDMFYIYRSGSSTECRMNENLVFKKTLTSLLGELTTWKRSESALGGGISLEILFRDKIDWQKTASEMRERPGLRAVWWDPFSNPDPDLGLLRDKTFERVLRAADLDFHHLLVLDMGKRDMSENMLTVVSRLSISGNTTRRLGASSVSRLINCLPRLKAFAWNVIPFARWKYEDGFYERLANTVCEWPTSLGEIEIRQSEPSCRKGFEPYHPLRSLSIATRFR